MQTISIRVNFAMGIFHIIRVNVNTIRIDSCVNRPEALQTLNKVHWIFKNNNG